MKLNSFDKVKQLTEEMVAIPSINKEPGGESAVARYMQDFYMSLPYFQAHPEQVKCFQTKNDFVVRHSTLAYVKGTKGNSNRTVILIGHIDTVGVDDFGTIREYAFRCEELPAKLRETFVLPQEVIDDIESGEYLFGRGALDMKSGVAGHMYLIQYFSEHPEELDGNLLAIGECDEEDNSKGIITALDLLEELKEKEHFEYVACINADYSTNYAPGDENRYIYYGSIGKLLPCFAVFGKEAHVGQAFSALDPMTRRTLQQEMKSLQQKLNKTIVFVTHDMDEAIKLADRICIIQSGHIVQCDTPENILKHPANQYVSTFIGENRLWSNPGYIRAADIMRLRPKTVNRGRTVLQALQMMRQGGVDSLLMVDEKEHLLGVVWLTELMEERDGSAPVEDYLSDDYVAVEEDTTLQEIIANIDYDAAGIIPVVDRQRILRGFLTKSSLLATMSRQFVPEQREGERSGVICATH